MSSIFLNRFFLCQLPVQKPTGFFVLFMQLIRKLQHSVFRDFLFQHVYRKKYQCDVPLRRRLCPQQYK